ncbi:MAG: LysR family transcriptional regulator, partial [Cyanobacteria bacterium J06576_12]
IANRDSLTSRMTSKQQMQLTGTETMAGKPAKKLSEKVKLSQLRTLVAIAHTGSFSEAAYQQGVSQSTVSHSLAALEAALGVMLIHRGRQRASLTPVGDRIYTQAQQALSLIETMGQEASRARGVDGGLVRLAAFRSLASEILPGAIAHFHEHHPTVQVTIAEFESTQALIDALHEGKADLTIASLLIGDEFDTFKIMEDQFIALLPPGFQQPDTSAEQLSDNTAAPELSWEQLRTEKLITSSSDCCIEVRDLLQRAQPSIQVDYLISNDSTAVSMTRQGLGITLLPELATQPIPSEVRVAQLPFHMTRPLGISWLRNTLLTPATYAFLDTFKHLDRIHQQGNPQYGGCERAPAERPFESTDKTSSSDEKTALSTARHH